MSAQYDVWVLRDGAVHHRGTTDTTLGVLRPTEIGAIAKGAVVLMYRGGTKAQQAQLLKAAQERALRGAPPASMAPPLQPARDELRDGELGDCNEGSANGCDGEDERPARVADDDCDEDELDEDAEEATGLEAPRGRERRTVQAEPPAASARSASPRPVYRPPPAAPPSTLFAAAPLPCRDCGETEGHTPRCPRNPDAEILPEPIYAPRPAAVVCERSIERAANVAATWSAAPPAANDTEAPVVPVVTELDLGPALDPLLTLAPTKPVERVVDEAPTPPPGGLFNGDGGAGAAPPKSPSGAAQGGAPTFRSRPEAPRSPLRAAALGAGGPGRGLHATAARALRPERPSAPATEALVIDSAVVGIAGVVAYLREVDASRSGCALACCAEPAAEGPFCRQHQLDMEVR